MSIIQNKKALTPFPQQEDLGHREWGSEILIGLVPEKFSLKKLLLKAGSRGGLQYHHKKDEIGFLVSGVLIVRYDSGDGVLVEKKLSEGDTFHFPPGFVHQEEAVTDCIIIEASTPYFNDRVRVEDRYGLEMCGGLPSTDIDDVILK